MKYIKILVESSYHTSQNHLSSVTKTDHLKRDTGYPTAFSVQAETFDI